MEQCKARSDAVRVCFSICSQLKRSLQIGILATDLLMRFLIKYPTYQARHFPSILFSEKSITEHLAKYLLLYTISCIRLASKNISVNKAVKIHEIQRLLLKHNLQYSITSIIKSEFIVFETIDFHVPYRTILDESEYLIEQCNTISGLNITELHNKCMAIVKLLYLLNDAFYSKLKWVLGKRIKSSDIMNSELDNLLPSAVVMAGCILLSKNDTEVIKKLSIETENSTSDIEGIANVMLLVILKEL